MILKIETFNFGHVEVTLPEHRNQEFKKLSPERQKLVMDFMEAALTGALNLSMRVLDIEISHIDET